MYSVHGINQTVITMYKLNTLQSHFFRRIICTIFYLTELLFSWKVLKWRKVKQNKFTGNKLEVVKV